MCDRTLPKWLSTHKALLFVHLIGMIEVFLPLCFISAHLQKGTIAEVLPGLLLLPCLSLSWALGHRLIYQDGEWVTGSSPALRKNAYKWFLAFYIPHLLYSLLIVSLLISSGQAVGILLALLLTCIKAALLWMVGKALHSAASPT